ncbi:MAG: helix-turn-helix domain-containing protein [Archangium sp.]
MDEEETPPQPPPQLQPKLGRRLRRARMRLELTQEQVARAVGFVPTVYGRIERGDMVPSTPKLRALCELLGVSADVLLGLRTEVSAAPDEASSAASDAAPDSAPARAAEEALELRRLTVLVRELPPDKLRLLEVIMDALQELDEE